MITCGIDVGAENTKAVVAEDGKVIGKASVLTGLDQQESAHKALGAVLKETGKTEKDMAQIVATGMGRDAIKGMVTKVVNEFVSAGKGTNAVFPSARVVIDAGAEEGRAVKLDEAGKVKDFAVNEKCAAGAGTWRPEPGTGNQHGPYQRKCYLFR